MSRLGLRARDGLSRSKTPADRDSSLPAGAHRWRGALSSGILAVYGLFFSCSGIDQVRKMETSFWSSIRCSIEFVDVWHCQAMDAVAVLRSIDGWGLSLSAVRLRYRSAGID